MTKSKFDNDDGDFLLFKKPKESNSTIFKEEGEGEGEEHKIEN